MAVLKYKDPVNNIWKNISISMVVGRDVPIGGIAAYSALTEPEGYLFCDGRSLLRNDYAELFAVIGTTYGSTDTQHFNLPDLRERVVVGKSATSPYNNLGNKGGEAAHTLTTNEIPSHVHYSSSFRGTGSLAYDSWRITRGDVDGVSTGKNTDPTGGGQSHNNLQPYIILNYIIKYKESQAVIAEVIDNLNSDSEIDALSARQGKILNEKTNKLVKEFTLAQDSNIFTVDGLDIQKDGGIYDVYVQFSQNITDATAVGLRINNIDTNIYSSIGMKTIGDTVPTQVYAKSQSFYRLGALRGNYTAFCRFTITEDRYGNTRYAITSEMYSDGIDLDYENIAGNIFMTGNPNLTSFSIFTVNSNEKFTMSTTKVKVYKR